MLKPARHCGYNMDNHLDSRRHHEHNKSGTGVTLYDVVANDACANQTFMADTGGFGPWWHAISA